MAHGYKPTGPPAPPKKKKPQKQQSGYTGHSDVQSGGRRDYRPPPQQPQETPEQVHHHEGGFDVGQPPQRTLAHLGINKTVPEFNTFLDHIHATFSEAYGRPPSPGLAFDILRSPLQVHEIPNLFSIPDSTLQAQAQSTRLIHQQNNPEPVFYQRPDGFLDLHSPFADWLGQQTTFSEQAPAEQSQQIRRNEPRLSDKVLRNKYPWLSTSDMGVPLDPQKLWEAMKTISSTKLTPHQAQILMGGDETLQHYTQRAELAQTGHGIPGGFTQPGAFLNKDTQAFTEKQAKFLSVANSVKTVRGAQKAFKTFYPGWFDDLKTDGNFNRTWGQRVVDLHKTAVFAKTATEFQAQKEGLSVSDFIQAWHNKQNILRKHPMYFQSVSQLPLKYLVHPDSMTGSSGDLLKGLTSGVHLNRPSWDWVPVVTGVKVAANSLGLMTDLVGGSLDEGKAWGAAMGIALHHAGSIFDKKSTRDQLHAKLTRALIGNPTWLQMGKSLATGDPKIPNTPAWNAINGISNVVIDAAVLWGGNYGGFVPRSPANVTRVLGHRFFKDATDSSFRELTNFGEDGVFKASQYLGGGRGAEQLATAAAKDAKSGKMTLEEYRSLAARAYNFQRPVHNGKAIESDLLKGLAHKKLPTKSIGWQRVKGRVAGVADSIDSSSGVGGNALNSFVQGLRSEFFTHVSARGGIRSFYEPQLGRRIYDYTLQTWKDPKLAKKWSSEVSRLRALEDNPGLDAFFQKMDDKYHKDFPNVRGKAPSEDSTFQPTFLTEAPSRGRFPSGGEPDVFGVFDRLAVQAKRLNSSLNRVGRFERKVIVAGEPVPGLPIPLGWSLFEKHATADLFRGLNAGMIPVKGRGAIADAGKDIGALLKKNPKMQREYDMFVSRTELGEQRYMLSQSAVDSKDFNTGEEIAKRPGMVNFAKRRAYMLAAARYTSHILDDESLSALTASTPDNLRPLEEFIQSHPEYRNIAFGRFKGEVKPPPSSGLTFRGKGGKPGAEKTGIHPAVGLQAKAMYARYLDFVKAGQEAGFRNPVAEAKAAYATVRSSHKDEALAKWIDGNKVSFDVNGGLVARTNWMDDTTNRAIGTLMSPNKLYRRKLAETSTRHLYADWMKANPEANKAEVLRTAMATSEELVKFHMLDLSNMMKAEQDFRHLTWFSTKHRLYWKYLLGLGFREPKYLAVAHDVQKHLDPNGNINLDLAGVKFAIPVYRLGWINNREQPDVSPLWQAGVGFGKALASPKSASQVLGEGFKAAGSTGGNVFTRFDQTWLTARKLAFTPKTVEGATAGMTDREEKQFNRIVNVFQAAHPHVSEQDAVKYGLVQYTWRSALQSGTAIPTLLSYDQKDLNETQKLWLKFGDLKTGKQKSEFLNKHPNLEAQIAQTKDPQRYHHMRVFGPRLNNLSDVLDRHMHQLEEDYQTSGRWTPKLEAQYRRAHKEYSGALDQLLAEDAQTWPGSPSLRKGVVREGLIIHPGPLGKQLEGNPLQARQALHKIFKNIPEKELAKHSIGETQVWLQDEIRDWKKKGPKLIGKQATQDLLSKLYERLSPFFGYPQDAPSKYHDSYYKIVDSYRKKRDAWRAQIKSTTQAALKDRAYEELRAFTDAHDKPVPVTIGGKTVTFPSPVKIGYALATKPQRQQETETWLSDNWNHLPRYAKEQLGRPVSENVTKGWLAYTLYFSALQHKDAHAIKRLEKQFNVTGVKQLPIGVEIRKQGKYDYHNVIAGWVDQQVGAKGAFLKDYKFSKQPKLKQLQALPGVSKSPRFEHMLSVANDFLHKRGYIHAPAHVRLQTWQRYDGAELQRWYQAQPKWFQHGLGPDFVNKLVSSG